MHFKDITTLILQPDRHLVQRSFGVLAYYGLSGTVLNHCLRTSLVLIDAPHYIFNFRKAVVYGARGLLC